MKRIFLIVKTIVFLSLNVNGQLWELSRYEATASIGTTQFFGDIGGFPNQTNVLGFRDFSFLNTGMNINTSLRYRILRDVAVRVNLTGGFFHANDAAGAYSARGFVSTTSFFEPDVIGEYYFIKNTRENNYLFLKGKKPKVVARRFTSIDAYALAGIGGLFYNVNPNATLAPQATNLNGFTEVVPLGLGVKYIYSPRVVLGFEFGARLTFSDNIDGYSSTGVNHNDIYHFYNLTFTYRIRTRRSEK